MNRLMIIGNLTRDPELRQVNTSNGQTSCVTYTVAVNRPRKGGQDQGADFFRVTNWGARADNDSKYLRKGSKVCVVGPVHVDAYTTKDGKSGASMEVTAQEVEYLSRAEDATAETAAPAPVIDQASGMEVVEQQELPF